jgi:putative ABC transport system permease protein
VSGHRRTGRARAALGGAVIRAASGGVSRRLVQTLVTFAVVATATAAAVLGITLLTSANAAAQNARAASHGADISVTVDGARATGAELAATKSVPGVSQVAGPYPEANVTLRFAVASPGPRGGPGGGPVGPSGLGGRQRGVAGSGARPAPGSAKPGQGGSQPGHNRPPRLVTVLSAPPGGSSRSARGSVYSQRTVIGRPSSGGPLDDLTVDSGHWLTGLGQIVLPPYEGAPPIGSTVTVVSAPGKPRLTVVGYGGSAGRFGDGWVLPGELAALRPAGAPARAQMLYTFARAGNVRQITADVAALRAALPAGAIVSYQSWLDAIGQTSGESSFNTPFVLAFALLAVALAILIVASLVSGAVIAGRRRIGVLKSIGFTPLQVGAAYVGQAGVPAVAGIAAGIVAGNLWATPILSGPHAGLLGPGSQHVAAWIDVAVPAAMALLVALAALIPALHAARLPAVQVVASGQAPSSARGYAAHRLAARLAMPRAVTIGLAAPFGRPARAATTLAAILFGATAVIMAAGLNASVSEIYTHYPAVGLGQVAVGVPKGSSRQALTAAQRRQAQAAIRAQPGTRRLVADYDNVPGSVGVTGITALNIEAYGGSSAWLGWPMIAGTWYRGRAQVDANTEFMTETGLHAGDRLTINVGRRRVVTRIVGQVYDPNGPSLWTSRQTLGTVAGLGVTDYRIGLRPGITPGRYAAALSRKLGPDIGVHLASAGTGASPAVPSSLIRALTELVALLAGLGVLSSVLMATRERVHDLGVFKSLGMTPRQVLTMVICGVIAPAVASAAIAVPAATYLHAVTVREIGAVTGSGMAAGAISVYHPAELLLLAPSGFVIAAVGAFFPASWAAASRTTAALRAE